MEEITRGEISSSDVLTNSPNSNVISSIGGGGGGGALLCPKVVPLSRRRYKEIQISRAEVYKRVGETCNLGIY